MCGSWHSILRGSRMERHASLSAVGPLPPFGRDELVRLDRVSPGFPASPSGVVCRAGSAPGFRPGGRVTFFWAQKKVTKEEASMPSSKEAQPCGPALDSRGGGWTGQGASSVDRGPERSLLVVGGRTVSDHPDPVRCQGRGACGANSARRAGPRPTPGPHLSVFVPSEQQWLRSSLDTARALAGPSATPCSASDARSQRFLRAGHSSPLLW